NLATGTYYVLAKADNANAVVESNENNNVAFSFAIRLGPDLTISSTTAPSIGGSGVQITVADTTKNQGGGAAGTSTPRPYLPATVGITSSATLLGTRAVPASAAGAFSMASTPVTLPPNLATGTYYIIGSADSANQVVETNETNNNGFGAAIKIGPDLIE